MYDLNIQTIINKIIGPSKTNDIFESVNDFNSELTKHHLINSNNEFTFDFSKVKAKKHWLKN